MPKTMKIWLQLVVFTVFTGACASAGVAETQGCKGELIEGPWFKFLLPTGMTVVGASEGKVQGSSVWLRTSQVDDQIAFYLFSPRHGDIAYPMFLGSTGIHKLVEFDNESGETIKYIISYDDGTIGYRPI